MSSIEKSISHREITKRGEFVGYTSPRYEIANLLHWALPAVSSVVFKTTTKCE